LFRRDRYTLSGYRFQSTDLQSALVVEHYRDLDQQRSHCIADSLGRSIQEWIIFGAGNPIDTDAQGRQVAE
jgi:hypothetical protein